MGSFETALGLQKDTWQIVYADTGAIAIEFKSFISCDVTDESTIVDSQVEEGSFASYNKVHKPMEVKVQLGLQGTDDELGEALDTLKYLRESTDLLNLVMPTVEYIDLNLEAYNYTLTSDNGRGVLFVDLNLKEVRQVFAQYTNEKIPAQKKSGKKQASDQGGAKQEKNQSMVKAMIS